MLNDQWNQILERIINEHLDYGEINISLTYYSSKITKIIYSLKEIKLLKENNNKEGE